MVALCLTLTACPAWAPRLSFALPTSTRVEPFETAQQLDSAAAATFVIMSDHKGLAPTDSPEMARLVRWTADMGAAFTVGLGDHLKKGRANEILSFVESDTTWRDQLYPNVADGENEFYGQSQADWSAGAPILDLVKLQRRDNVEIRANGSEYYAKLPLGDGFTVHLIQLHFPDNPADPDSAFREDSRAYMCSLLVSIPNAPTDVVVVGAHSKSGEWVSILRDDRRELLLDRAALILSATTHLFRRFDHGAEKALTINTGSVCHARRGMAGVAINGFVTAHLLMAPPRLVVQYVDAGDETRALAPTDRAFVKMLDAGATYPVSFGNGG